MQQNNTVLGVLCVQPKKFAVKCLAYIKPTHVFINISTSSYSLFSPIVSQVSQKQFSQITQTCKTYRHEKYSQCFSSLLFYVYLCSFCLKYTTT